MYLQDNLSINLNALKTMKTIISIIFLSVLFSACQKEKVKSPFHDGIAWTGSNDIANYLAMKGIGYLENVEREKAYVIFEEAVQLDSSLFACHTALAMLSRGEKRDYHKMMAKKYVEGKNETSRLFVSLLDIERDSTAAEKWAAVWAKMHEISDGPFIHFRYATSRSDTTEVLQELDKLEARLSELKMNTGHIHNIRGYIMSYQGDIMGGANEIEKYMELYPEGYNPLDSRAEFYLIAGDTATAIEYYKKAVNKFPFATSARNSLEALTKNN